MTSLLGQLSPLMLPLVVLLVGLSLFIAAWLFSRNYLKVSPWRNWRGRDSCAPASTGSCAPSTTTSRSTGARTTPSRW